MVVVNVMVKGGCLSLTDADDCSPPVFEVLVNPVCHVIVNGWVLRHVHSLISLSNRRVVPVERVCGCVRL